MTLLNPLAEQYAAAFTTEEDTLLQEIEAFTIRQHAHAHMLSGKVQGQLLSVISQLLRPRRVLEIGTFTGYSALSLARGLQQDGLLYTIELQEADAAIARAYFDRSPYSQQMIQLTGDARSMIPTLHDQWDIVFIDADKTGYIEYYELILPGVRPNGLIIADNVLFHGQVLHPDIKGKNAVAIHAFNEHVKQDDRVEQVLLALRDGLSFIRKKEMMAAAKSASFTEEKL